MPDLVEMDPTVWEYIEKKQISRLLFADVEDS
jgi:hypothetical protein